MVGNGIIYCYKTAVFLHVSLDQSTHTTTIPVIRSGKTWCCWRLKGKVGVIWSRSWCHVWNLLWLTSLCSVWLCSTVHLNTQHICPLLVQRNIYNTKTQITGPQQNMLLYNLQLQFCIVACLSVPQHYHKVFAAIYNVNESHLSKEPAASTSTVWWACQTTTVRVTFTWLYCSIVRQQL